MSSAVVIFNADACECVERTLREVAAHRKWDVCALKVLSNHVHIVVGVPEGVGPDKALSDFKAWATRRLREEKITAAQVPI